MCSVFEQICEPRLLSVALLPQTHVPIFAIAKAQPTEFMICHIKIFSMSGVPFYNMQQSNLSTHKVIFSFWKPNFILSNLPLLLLQCQTHLFTKCLLWRKIEETNGRVFLLQFTVQLIEFCISSIDVPLFISNMNVHLPKTHTHIDYQSTPMHTHSLWICSSAHMNLAGNQCIACLY